MNRLFIFILGCILVLSSCHKNIEIEPIPCVWQLNLPDSVGKWRIDTFALPKNERYNKDIFFIDANIGFLLKDYYTLFKTSDGGKTWAQISSFTNDEIASDVYFINENVGFVSVFGRPNARILTTVDGGKTWENRIYPMQGSFDNIQFLDNFHGFGLVSRLDSQNQLITAVFQTKNQGQTWEEVVRTDTFATKKSLQFLNDKKAFVIGTQNYKDYLLKSVDGGLTWQTLGLLPENTFDVKFADEQNGFLTTYSKCFLTTNGGLTWQEKTEIKGYPKLLFFGNPDDFLLDLETIQCDYGDYGEFQSQFLTFENNAIIRSKNVTHLDIYVSFFVNSKLGFVVWRDKLLRFTR